VKYVRYVEVSAAVLQFIPMVTELLKDEPSGVIFTMFYAATWYFIFALYRDNKEYKETMFIEFLQNFKKEE